MNKSQTSYLTEYCNLSFEWHFRSINIDNVTENQVKIIDELKLKALKQSGLTDNELTLICMRLILMLI